MKKQLLSIGLFVALFSLAATDVNESFTTHISKKAEEMWNSPKTQVLRGSFQFGVGALLLVLSKNPLKFCSVTGRYLKECGDPLRQAKIKAMREGADHSIGLSPRNFALLVGGVGTYHAFQGGTKVWRTASR